MRRLRENAGFTLIETLVAILVSSVVFGATLSAFDVFQSDNRLDQLRNEAQDNTRAAIDALARELRNGAAPSSLTPGALEKAGKYSIVFQTIEPTTKALPEGDKNTTNAIRVRYCLNSSNSENEILWRQTRKWETEKAPELPTVSTCPDPNTTDYETSVQVAQHIVNRIRSQKRSLFKYIPEEPASAELATAVEPNIYINVDPGQLRPGESQLTSTIDLRNENRLPVASFTAKETGGYIVQLNASQSTDPDGLALTYKWWDNSVAMPSTSAETETESLEKAKGTTQTFKLEVTTPSGLTATAERSVKIE
jgi:prepilin-type N-terminal cleavage/methylation domain-containing protein